MPADSNNPPELSQSAAGCVPGMTPWERFVFGFWPAWLTLLAVPLLAVTAFGLTKISVAFWPNSHWYFHHSDRLKIALETVLEVNAYTIAILGALLAYPALFLRKMLRRKKETGSVFPQGEELAARRRKVKNPSLRTRLALITFFALIAAGVTHSLMTSPHRQVLINWSIPALFWLITVIVAIEALSPSTERAWTGFVATGAFGLLTILAVAGNVHARTWGIGNWVFPLLMALFTAGLGIGSTRAIKRRRAAPGNEAS